MKVSSKCFSKTVKYVCLFLLIVSIPVSFCACATTDEKKASTRTEYSFNNYKFSVSDIWELAEEESNGMYSFSNGTDAISVYMEKMPSNLAITVNDGIYKASVAQQLQSSMPGLTIDEYEEYHQEGLSQKGFEHSALCKCSVIIEGKNCEIWLYLLEDREQNVVYITVTMPEDSDKSGIEEAKNIIDSLEQ